LRIDFFKFLKVFVNTIILPRFLSFYLFFNFYFVVFVLILELREVTDIPLDFDFILDEIYVLLFIFRFKHIYLTWVVDANLE
jgi:hypothetical protein